MRGQRGVAVERADQRAVAHLEAGGRRQRGEEEGRARRRLGLEPQHLPLERVGEGVQVLARATDHVVAVRQGRMLATAFHPEITGDRRVHRLFVDIVTGRA